MSGLTIGLIAGAGYFAGYIVTAIAGATYWFGEFGEEWEGVAWGCFGALIWPFIWLAAIPAFLVRYVAGRLVRWRAETERSEK